MQQDEQVSGVTSRISARGAVRVAVALAVWGAAATVGGGCAADNAHLLDRIATLEETNQELRDQASDLDRKLQIISDDMARQKKEGLVTCMRILFDLPPKWKQRLRMDLLDFGARGMNASVMAEADVAEGHVNILAGGVTNLWSSRADELRKEHNIWVMHIAGPNDGLAVFRLIQGYNVISKAAIAKKHGKDFLDNVFKPRD